MRHARIFWISILYLMVSCSDSDKSGSNSGGRSGTSGSGGTSGAAGSGGSGAISGSAGVSGAAPATCPKGFELGNLAGKPVFKGTINDGPELKFIYDSGAPTSGFDLSVIGNVGTGPHNLVIAGKTIERPALPAYDLSKLAPGYAGILGWDVMGGYSLTLDFDRSRFWLEAHQDEKSLLACNHVDRQPVRIKWLREQYIFVPGKAEHLQGWLLVDTGASLGAIPTATFNALQKEKPRPAVGGFYLQAGIGTFWSQLTMVKSLEVLGRRIEHIPTRTIPDGSVPLSKLPGTFLGVLPSIYLRHFMTTIDAPNGELRLDGYKGMNPVEPPRFFPLGVSLSEQVTGPVAVTEVLDGSSAKDQGVLVGDEVLSVEGKPISSFSPSQRGWLFVGQGLGQARTVSFKRGGQTLSVTLEARDLLKVP